jgi:Cft2 family RNA processing exonuclease
VVLLLIYGAILPLMKKISDEKDRIQEETLKQEITKKHVSELPKIQQQFDVLKNSSNSIDVLLDKEDKEKAVELIKRLENVSEASGTKITIAVQDAAAQKASNVVKSKNVADSSLANDLPSTNYLQFKITLEGDYNSIIKFVNTLENFEYYSDIIGIDIKKAEAENSKQVSSDGVLGNPFITGNSNAPADASIEKLSATLDTVFYTK